MSRDNTSVIVLDRSIASIERVHAELEKRWREHPWINVVDRMALETALIELATNVIRYALHDEGATAELRLATGDTELRARITDNGPEFHGDLEQITMPGSEAESTRGLALIDGLMDVFEYRRRASENRWTIIRRLTPPVAAL